MKRQIFWIAIILLFVGPLFHNCGEMASNSSGRLLSSACATDMHPVFEETYHAFFVKNKCSNCHSPSGIQGIPHFANPNTVLALDVFMGIGPDRVENKIKSGHQGYSFTNFEADLTKHKKTWTEAVQSGSCTNQAFLSSGKSIAFFEPSPLAANINVVKEAMKDWQTLTWNLDNGGSAVTKGVEISIDVKVVFDLDFNTPQNYLVNNIKIKTTQHDLRVKGIYILLNGKTYFVTTFKGIDVVVEKNSDFTDLNEGSSAAIFVKDDGEIYENADRWSVQIETLE